MPKEIQNQSEDDPWTDEQMRQAFTRADALAAWLLATLVAINTSGAGASALSLSANKRAAIAFAAGVFLAVLSGMTSWGEAYSHGSALSVERLSAQWRQLMERGEQRLDPQIVDESVKFIESGLWYRTRIVFARALFPIAFILNVLSLSAFAIGCLMAAGAI